MKLSNPADLYISEVTYQIAITLSMGSACTPPDIVHAGWQEATVWDNTLRAIQGTRSFFGYSRDRIEVAVTSRFGSLSQYRETSDFIVIHPNSVNGSWGVFTAGHEFGHAVHAQLPGPFPSGQCPGTHYLDAPSNSGCAYTEGFANFISVTSIPAGNYLAGPAESDFYKSLCQPNHSCEATFAAMLLDLVDPINSADADGFPDLIQLTPRRVLDIFGSCTLLYERRLEYGGEVVSSYWSVPSSTPQAADCLLNDGPRFIGPIAGYELWWAASSMPWPNLTGTTFTDVKTRMTRP